MQVVKVQKRKIILNFVVVILCICIGCYLKANLTPQSLSSIMSGKKIPNVLVEEVIKTDVSPQRKYIASVEAIKSVDLIPQVSGYVDEVLFQEGSVVKEGDLLFIIEQDRYIANVDLSKAALASAQANLVKTERDYKRQKALSSQQYASKSTLDTAESAYLQAKAAVAQAEANLELAKIDLKHTEIKAPITGLIGKAYVTEGNYVSSNTQTLARIIQASPIRVAFSVPDKDNVSFKRLGSSGLKTRLELPDGSILNDNMESYFVNNEVNKNTATIPIYLEYANKDRILVAGNYVNVILSSAEERPAIIISPTAVMQDANGSYVYVVDSEGNVSEKRVQLDGLFEDKQIVLSGLDEHEKVVVSGLQKIKDGSKVRASLVSNTTEEAK